MEINVTKNMTTGESTVLSTATVPPEELNQHVGIKVYDDGRKCVYALKSHEGSNDQSCVSELSATEVEKLLRSATVHHQNYRREEHYFYKDEKDTVDGCDLRHQRGHYGNHLLRNNMTEKDLNWRENRQRKPVAEYCCGSHDSHYRRKDEKNNHGNLREGHRLGNYRGLGNHYGNQKDHHYSSYQEKNCVQEDTRASRHNNGTIGRNSMVNGGRANCCPPPRSHDQEAVSAHQPQLCYTPSSYIPLQDYVSVDEEELYSFNQPAYYSHDKNQPTALFGGSTHSDGVPSPLYEDDTPYTILNAMDTTEPITAIFMGFQTAQDDSGQGQEFDGSLKAELVIIEDEEDNGDDNSMKERKSHGQLRGSGCPTGSSVNGNRGCVRGVGDKRMERRVGPATEEE